MTETVTTVEAIEKQLQKPIKQILNVLDEAISKSFGPDEQVGINAQIDIWCDNLTKIVTRITER